MRFARNVQFQIKTGKEQEFAGRYDNDVLPMLRKQNGFVEGLTLINPKGVQSISLWDNRENAEAYQSEIYPRVLASLTTVIEGTPTVETYENAASYSRN
jgi:hypothetical protein